MVKATRSLTTRSTTVTAPAPAPLTRRLGGLTSDGSTTIVSLGAEELHVVLPGAPDRRLATAAAAGLRRVLHVRIDARHTDVTCTLTGATRLPVRRRIPLGAALALADAGTPTDVATPVGA